MRLRSIAIEAGGREARLDAYLLDNTPAIDPNRARPAILILPGGGYAETSDREAEPIAVTMLSFGYQAFVLRYSVAPARYPTALMQVAHAMQWIRTHADECHVRTDAIMVAGFSADGHLATDFCIESSGKALADAGYLAADIRPNGLVLGYPVISSGRYAHRASFDRLLGPGVADDPSALAHVSLELRVDERTPMPPVFLFHTMSDPSVPVENSLLLLDALHRAGVEVEAHLFPTGRHGVALGSRESMYDDGTGVERCVQVWPALFHRWAVDRFEGGDGLQP